MRILVVEDNDRVASFILKGLREEGYAVDHAARGDDATRMARLAKIQQLSRMGRLYRLRGLALRAVRALMILQLLNRMFRIGPERQLKKLNMILEDKEKEIALLRREIEKLETLIAQQQEAEAAEAKDQADASTDVSAGEVTTDA